MDKQEKLARYRSLNRTAKPGQIVFAGSSLMEMFPVEKLVAERAPEVTVYNRGVGGFITTELEAALDVCVLDLKPRRLFINIGTNDLSDAQVTIDELIVRYERILDRIGIILPPAAIYLMAYYPINELAAAPEMKACLAIRTNARIGEANRALEDMAHRRGHRFINVNRGLMDETGRLRAAYTLEGMHIREEGYRAIMDDLMPYVLEPDAE